MSGMIGLYRLDGLPVSGPWIKKMNVTLLHRGLDGAGVWWDGPIGFGHQMTFTTSESSREKLPLANPEMTVFLTCDVRLDNREDLYRALNIQTKKIDEIADSELIMAGYLKWGRELTKRLMGDFAFAIWDKPRDLLYIARDPFGVKPFYYYRSGQYFAFGSEIKAILSLPFVSKKINQIRLADHLIWSAEDKEMTFYENIWRLKPAHEAIITRHKMWTSRYWDLNPYYEIGLKSNEEYAERFRTIFSSAVRSRLRSHFPVGSLLSGGLDTSSIVSVARRHLIQQGKKIHTFSAVFQSIPECDEREYMEEVAKLPGVEPHLIQADQIRPFIDIDKIFWHLDEAHQYNLAMFWAGVYQKAKQNGVRVLLDGDGGDEVASRGYPHLAELFGSLKWIRLWRDASQLSKNIRKPFCEVIWQKAMRPYVPRPMHQMWRWIRWGGRPLWLDDTLISPDFAQRVNLSKRAERFLRHEESPPKSVRIDDWLGLESGALTYGLEVPNRAAAAFGIEPRYPFYDRRLVEYCLAVPSDQKLRGGWTKAMMREAMKEILPEKIRVRPHKTYLDQNITQGLLKFEMDILDQEIWGDTSHLAPYVNIGALRQVYRRFQKKPDYESTTSLWQIAMLSMWLKKFESS